MAGFAKLGEQPDGLNHFLLLQWGDFTGGCTRPLGTGGACTTGSATAFCSLSGCDELQQLVWVVQPVLEFGAERLGRELCSHGDFSRRGIRSYILDFVNSNG